MKKGLALGVDIGSISTKGALIDDVGNIVASEYIWTEGDPVAAVCRLLQSLRDMAPDAFVTAVGTTGSARRIIGAMLDADCVKNEITAHAIGTLTRYPDVRTIIEIGGQDSKIIIIKDGVVSDYAMNTLCAAGTGAFLSSQAKRLGLKIEELGELAIRSKAPSKIAARCTVFAESDLIHKAQVGHKREDLVAGLCRAVASNYLNNVGKGKKITPPVIFQGGVSKNRGVIEAFKMELGEEIHVDPDSHLMGALGAARLAAAGGVRPRPFDFSLINSKFETSSSDCRGCANNCELVRFFRNGEQLFVSGGRCEKASAEH